MGATMKRNRTADGFDFDRAMTDVFQQYPEQGEFGVVDELRRRRMINRILSPVIARELPSAERYFFDHRQNRKWWGIAAVAVVVVVVAVASVFLWADDNASAENNPIPLEKSYFGEVAEDSNNLFLDNHRASFRSALPIGKSIHSKDGSAGLQLPTGITWWMAQGSRGKIAEADATHINVSLQLGESWFNVDPQRKGPAFFVTTPLGRIQITGTIFVVRTTPTEVIVTLLKGQVWIDRTDGKRSLLKAGHEMRLRGGIETALSQEEKNTLQQHLDALAWETPSAMEVGPNEKPDELNPAVTIIDTACENPSPVQNRNSPATPKNNVIDVSRIHKKIQANRKTGNWNRVAALYQKLIQSAPGSAAAIVSRVSLGEVYLTRLHRYNDALFHYKRYIQSGHKTLLPEATYGKCISLNALGNKKSERRCLQSFVRKFPHALQVPDAQKRIDAISF